MGGDADFNVMDVSNGNLFNQSSMDANKLAYSRVVDVSKSELEVSDLMNKAVDSVVEECPEEDAATSHKNSPATNEEMITEPDSEPVLKK